MELEKKIVKILIGGGAFAISMAIASKYIAINFHEKGIAEFGLTRDIIKAVVMLASLTGGAATLRMFSSNEYSLRDSLYALKNIYVLWWLILVTLSLFIVENVSDFLPIAIPQVKLIIIGIVGTLSIVLISLINSRGLLFYLSAVQVVSSVVFLVIIIVSKDYKIKYEDAFIAMYTINILLYLTVIIKERKKFEIKSSKSCTSKKYNEFIGLINVSLISGLVGIYTTIELKTTILNYLGVRELGYFEAANTIVISYMALIYSAVGSYVIPKYTAFTNFNNNLEKSLNQETFKIFIYVSLLITLTFMLAKDIIEILYSLKFDSSTNILRLLLIGDAFKITSAIIGFILITKAKVLLPLSLNLFFNVLYYYSGSYLSKVYQIEGLAYGYILTNILYFVLSIVLLAYYEKIKINTLNIFLPFLLAIMMSHFL